MEDKYISDNKLAIRADKTNSEIQYVRSEILKRTMEFFLNKEFLLYDPPVIHEYIPDKKSEIYFSIENRKFALNSSNALYLSEYAVSFGNAFAMSPTFRNENSSNHLTEFKMLEVEILECRFDECFALVSEYIKYILYHLSKMKRETVFKNRLKTLHDNFQIKKIPYEDIIEKLKSGGLEIEYGADLSDYDQDVSRVIDCPTFIIDYPISAASWTALPKDKRTAYAFNLILPDQYGELAEGCQRNNNHKMFVQKFKEAKIGVLNWFANAVEHCDADRSGFGLGIDRLVRWATGCSTITDTVLFPRFIETQPRPSDYTNRAMASLFNMTKKMNRKNIEIGRITKTAELLVLSGLSPRLIEKGMLSRCANSQNDDGGFIGTGDTFWSALLLSNFEEYHNNASRAIQWLRDNENPKGGFGRSRRDMSRIPVTGLLLYLLPQLAEEKHLKWLEKEWLSEANSLTYKAAYTLLAFKTNNFCPKKEDLINDTIRWLATQQEENGGFAPWRGHPVGANIYCTAIAALGLLCYGKDRYRNKIISAYDYMKATQLGSGIWPYHEIEDGSAWGLYAMTKIEEAVGEADNE